MPFLEGKNFKRVSDQTDIKFAQKDSFIYFRGDKETPVKLGLLRMFQLVLTSLGYTPEDVANKQNNLTASATKYPTVDAVNAGLASITTTINKDYTIQFLLMGG